MRHAPARVGLTGGIAAGKSTVARMFAALGAPVFDLDAAGRRVLAEDAAARRELAACFGAEILDAGGMVDRRRLAARAFATEEGAQRLNAIMHPRIWRRMEDWLASLHGDAPYALIEASALIESGGAARMDAVVVVLADRAMRMRRAAARDGRSPEEIARIMARQVDDAARLRAADWVIRNDNGMDALRRQVARVHAALLARFGGDEAAGHELKPEKA